MDATLGGTRLDIVVPSEGNVIGVWVRIDDVPGMQKTGYVAEAAEGKIDEGVGGTESNLDPNCKRGSV